MGGSFENRLQYCYYYILAVVTDSKRQCRYCLIELAILLTHFMKEYFNSFDNIQFFHTLSSISRDI